MGGGGGRWRARLQQQQRFRARERLENSWTSQLQMDELSALIRSSVKEETPAWGAAGSIPGRLLPSVDAGDEVTFLLFLKVFFNKCSDFRFNTRSLPLSVC